MLSAAEKERGWVEFECPTHGFLVATTPRADVRCGCGKRAGLFRDSQALTPMQRSRAKRNTVMA